MELYVKVGKGKNEHNLRIKTGIKRSSTSAKT